MNERIKQLANKAGFDFGRDWQVIGQSEDSLKVFAELIVKECMDQARDEIQYEHDDKLADAVAKRVLKHFGVEE